MGWPPNQHPLGFRDSSKWSTAPAGRVKRYLGADDRHVTGIFKGLVLGKAPRGEHGGHGGEKKHGNIMVLPCFTIQKTWDNEWQWWFYSQYHALQLNMGSFHGKTAITTHRKMTVKNHGLPSKTMGKLWFYHKTNGKIHDVTDMMRYHPPDSDQIFWWELSGLEYPAW